MEDGVVLKSSDAEYYVLVRDTVFNAFNDIKRADLVKAPEADGEAAGIRSRRGIHPNELGRGAPQAACWFTPPCRPRQLKRSPL